MGQALPESRLAAQNKGTNPSTPHSNRVVSAPRSSWPLTTGNWPLPLGGRAVPALPCAGGRPPQRPPVNATVRARPQLPCQRQPCRRHQVCASAVPPFEFRRFEFRFTAVQAVQALPCAGGRPPQRPLVAMPPCLRLSCLCTSASEGMPPRPQLACQSHPRRCHRACAVPAYRRRAADTTLTCARGSRSSNCDSRITTHESQITTHESRITTPDSRLTTHDSRLPTPDSRLTTPDSRLPTHDSRITNHESRITNRGQG